MMHLKSFGFIIVAAAWLSCNGPGVADNTGGASETVNAVIIARDSSISVTIVAPKATQLSLTVADNDYNPYVGTGYIDKASGTRDTYRFAPKFDGVHNVFIIDGIDETGAKASVTLRDSASDTAMVTFAPLSSLEGAVRIPEDTASVYQPYALAVKGSPFYAITNKDYTFTIAGLPKGDYAVMATPSYSSVKPPARSKESLSLRVSLDAGESKKDLTFYFSQ